MATINNGEMGHTSETHAFVMGLTVEKVDDLTRKELSGFADADLELAGRAFGDGDIAIVLGKLDGEGFYNQIDGERDTVDADVFQGECQTSSIKDNSEALKVGFLQLRPNPPIASANGRNVKE